MLYVRLYVDQSKEHAGDNVLSKAELDSITLLDTTDFNNINGFAGIECFYNLQRIITKNPAAAQAALENAGIKGVTITDPSGNSAGSSENENLNNKSDMVKPANITETKKAEKITISQRPVIQKPSVNKNKITVKWKKFKLTKKTKAVWKRIKKVQVQCATDKGFKNIVKTNMVSKKKTKVTLKGLKKKTSYYVRVRYYDGKGYSKWSKIKKVKTKK